LGPIDNAETIGYIKSILQQQISKMFGIPVSPDIIAVDNIWMTSDNYAAFYGLLNRLPTSDREELKRSIVLQYTDGRTASLHEMSRNEYSAALEGMRKLVLPTERERFIQERRKRRSAVLHQMQLLGVDTANWDRVNSFCLDSRIAGKEFRDLDCGELDALLKKIRAIRRKEKK
jgi:hypothetical protein